MSCRFSGRVAAYRSTDGQTTSDAATRVQKPVSEQGRVGSSAQTVHGSCDLLHRGGEDEPRSVPSLLSPTPILTPVFAQSHLLGLISLCYSDTL